MNDLERKMVYKMIRLYCHANHGQQSLLCFDCRRVNHYAQMRLRKCPFGEQKPACKKCPQHCYNREMKDKIRLVMRYSGWRFLFYDPGFAVLHLLRSVYPGSWAYFNSKQK